MHGFPPMCTPTQRSHDSSELIGVDGAIAVLVKHLEALLELLDLLRSQLSRDEWLPDQEEREREKTHFADYTKSWGDLLKNGARPFILVVPHILPDQNWLLARLADLRLELLTGDATVSCGGIGVPRIRWRSTATTL